MWPALLVVELNKVLPSNYSAEPRVHLGTNFEVDVCAFEPASDPSRSYSSDGDQGEAVATATWAPTSPTLLADTDLTEMYQYEVLIFDHARARELVAAIEIASPGNQDRPSTRRAFVNKCATLLQQRVCVTIIDLVTTRHFNLYCQLLDSVDVTDRKFCDAPAVTYSATCRGRMVEGRPRFETWAYPLNIDHPLPTLPVWLDKDLAIPLELEASYMAACAALRLL